MTGLYQLWYKDYDRASFHFFNDSKEWLQMDKIGHIYTSYYFSKICKTGFQWTGMDNKKSAIYGGGVGLLFISSIEIFDGFSEKWGASNADIIANILGAGLYIGQELTMEQQKIVPKFSFHKTEFAKYRPDALGKNFNEMIIKDYNGQTYWLSVNLYSFMKNDKIPEWLNLAVGYSADGMLGGIENPSYWNNNIFPCYDRKRQWYLSLDIDFTSFKTRSKFINILFHVINCVKVPFPAIEFEKNKIKPYFLYF